MSKTLRDLRIEQNLSIAELSFLSGISQTHLRELESGKCDNPTLDVVSSLAFALGYSLYEICIAIRKFEKN